MSPYLRALLCGAATLMPLAVQAKNDPQDPAVVEEVIVTGRRDPEDSKVVADARARLSETPGAVAVVSAEAYETRFAPTLADSLRDVAGVFAQKKWGDDIRLSIRGSGIGNNAHNRGTLLAQDGVPFNEADGFGDFQLIDPATARYTEVYKGGNALRFGGALLGGAVNLVTPTGLTAGGSQIRIDGGSFETLRAHGEYAFAGDVWDGFGALTLIDAGGFRDHSQTASARLSANIGRGFGDEREVRLHLTAGDLTQEIPGALPLPDLRANPRQALRSTQSDMLDSHRNMTAARVSLQTRWRLNDAVLFEGGAYAIWKDLDHPIFQVIDQQSRNYGLFGRVDWEGEAFGKRADAFYGAWYRTGDLDARQWINLRSNRGALTAFSFQDSGAADLFAEGRLFLTERIALIAGGTYGRAGRDFINNLDHSRDRSRTFTWYAPRLGLMWQADDGTQAYANVTRSVEPPNMSALAQNNTAFIALEPQDAVTFEAGARGRRGALTWDVSAYRARIDDELLTFTPGPNIPAASFNAKETVHQGLEAALDWRITARLRLRQTYAWSDFRFASDVAPGDGLDGKRLPVAPEHLYRAELKYAHPDGWFVAPSVEWVPSGPFVDYRNTLTSPSYAVVSLNAGMELSEGVKIFADVRNLTDQVYISNVNAVVNANGDARTPSFWPGDGRSVFIGLTAQF